MVNKSEIVKMTREQMLDYIMKTMKEPKSETKVKPKSKELELKAKSKTKKQEPEDDIDDDNYVKLNKPFSQDDRRDVRFELDLPDFENGKRKGYKPIKKLTEAERGEFNN